MGNNEQTLMRELLEAVKKMTADALRLWRPDLTQTTGVLPGQQLPTGGPSGTGYPSAPHAATHEDGGSDEVDLGSLAGTLTDTQHGDRGNGTLHSAATISTPGFVQLAASGGTTAGQAVQASDTRLSDSRAPSGSAGGDLGGTYPNPTVAKLQSRAMASTAPSDGQAIVWDNAGSTWKPGTASGGTPAAHASTHQHSGSDEVATATAGANAIVKAGSGGTIADGWLSSAISRITSIALSLPSIFSVSGSPLTANGTITATLANQSANTVLSGPSSGAATAPTFRALVAGDIPSLPASQLTSGQLALARGGTAADLSATGGSNQIVKQTSVGGALSVAVLAAADIPSLDTSKLTTGQLALARGGSGADLSATGGSNQVVKQTSVGGALTVATLSTSDIPSLDSSKITTGEIPRSPLTTRGDLLTQNPAGTHTRLAVGAAARYLRSNGTDPSWAQLDGADLTSASVTYAKIQNVSATDKLLGRSTAGAGTVEEIALTSAGRALIDDTDAAAQRTTLGLGAAALLSTPIAIASGGTGQTGATAAFNGLSPITTRGDLITRDATNNIRLAIGASGKFVRSDGTDPSWQLLVAGDIPSLAASIITSGQLAVAQGGTGVAAIPSFSVHKNGTNQTGIVSSTFTKITFGTEVFDTNNNFASSTFTPTIAGTYLLTSTLLWLNNLEDQKTYYAAVYKNGTRHKEERRSASGTGAMAVSITTFVQANGSTDYFEIYGAHEAVANMTVYGDAVMTHFSGAWVGP
jgi:trimeric autotransporter adhesin